MGGVFFITPHSLSRVPEQEFFPIFGGEYPNESCIRLELHLAMSDIIGEYCLQAHLGDGEVAARASKVDIGFCHVSLILSKSPTDFVYFRRGGGAFFDILLGSIGCSLPVMAWRPFDPNPNNSVSCLSSERPPPSPLKGGGRYTHPIDGPKGQLFIEI